MNIGQSHFQIMTPEQSNPAINMYTKLVQQHLQNMHTQSVTQGQMLGNQKAQALLPYVGPQADAQLQQSQLANKLAQILMPYKQQEAQQNVTMNNQKIQFAPGDDASSNALKNAQAAYYGQAGAQGGMRPSVSAQHDYDFSQSVQTDNPNLTKEQVRDAMNAYATGSDELPDGTQLAKPSASTMRALGVWTKDDTTSPLLTTAVKSNQAESEIKSLSDMSTKDMAPYAETYAGYSPQQIMDTLSKDPSTQTQLGNFAASQAVQFEISQLRQKLAGATPTEGDTKRLMDSSQQTIKALFPHMSAEARAQTNKRINEYFDNALQQRQKVGINAAQTLPGYGSQNNAYDSLPAAGASDNSSQSQQDLITQIKAQYPKASNAQIMKILQMEQQNG